VYNFFGAILADCRYCLRQPQLRTDKKAAFLTSYGCRPRQGDFQMTSRYPDLNHFMTRAALIAVMDFAVLMFILTSIIS
jgi:hypothetical protein